MPAAMHLTVLVSLFAVTVCAGTNSPEDKQMTMITASATNPTSLTVTKINGGITSSVKTTNNTPQLSRTTHQITTAVTSEKVSSSLLPLTSPQTLNTTAETLSTPPPQTATTNQTSNETVSHGSTLPPASESPNTNASVTVNTTTQAVSHNWEKGGLTENPGLVAVLCIFCIVLILVLVVATAKCIRSPRPNFERLEDVPLSKVNEQSPFAQYSK